MQIAELSNNKAQTEDRLRSAAESHQRTVRSLESRILVLQDDLQVTRSELETCQAEYEGYKVFQFTACWTYLA